MNSLKIASRVIETLRTQGLDCVRQGGYYDVSGKIHRAVFDAVNEETNAHIGGATIVMREQPDGSIKFSGS